METPLLSVVTITYNHEPYIEKTIQGVLMQKVNFPIEFIIAEDCSTDNTRAICQKYANDYPDLIKLIISDNNVGIFANERRAMLAARGKYIAFCEGDDYWTNPDKLQKQVDFLESHLDYSVCFHRCKHFNVDTKEVKEDLCGTILQKSPNGCDVDLDLFFGPWITQPLTMVYRASSFDLDIALQYQYYRDMHLIYHLLKNGKGFLFPFCAGIRNVHEGGMFSTSDLLKQCTIGLKVAKELYKHNKDKYTKCYLCEMLQWNLYNPQILTINRKICYSFQLFFLNKDFKKMIKNMCR